MAIIRCETCKGTGMLQNKKEHREQIHQGFKTITDITEQITCYNCGGSGCKWVESEATDE